MLESQIVILKYLFVVIILKEWKRWKEEHQGVDLSIAAQ